LDVFFTAFGDLTLKSFSIIFYHLLLIGSCGRSRYGEVPSELQEVVTHWH